ncbi:cystathionine gamma-synthase [Venturia nashicola]|uniref:cystathionine gamma-synthase n=1 Tax=Venturia nashicola TaxID=86259 RepID=A0A4Z1NTD6_9PEZI|nr:cystathionine gamma-synthase [Venturia nashicola]TLD20038.1 cystathionine gamma-synthase [Venturia nashicola]
MPARIDDEVGETIPAMTDHAVSVSLPTWRANVGYEEGEEWVLSKLKTGYPRFFIHKQIQAFASAIVDRFGAEGESAMLFPSYACASRCVDFFRRQSTLTSQVRILDLAPNAEKETTDSKFASPHLSAVLFPSDQFSIAKTFWQHSGEGVSSRRAEYCHELLKEGLLAEKNTADTAQRLCKGPRRYRKSLSSTHPVPIEGKDSTAFIEERFGRNLEIKFAEQAKSAVKRRIAGSLTADIALEDALTMKTDGIGGRHLAESFEDDVYLYPCGMNAIFNTHRSLMAASGQLKSVMYGFPYIDTLKILEKFGPGCIFYGHGSAKDLDDLELRLSKGERILSLFCEFPGNPLLMSPDLKRIRDLADKYDFAVVVDETVGNFLNVNVLPYADVVVSSLTKIFSGDSNVMGGSAILNPKGRRYTQLKKTWSAEFEDNYWAEDAIFMERNSRDFVSRIDRINSGAEAICEVLQAHPRVKQVYYPKYSPSRPFYDQCRTPNGRYGGLLSATFYDHADAVTFFDNLATAKGPSLGTNFTLSSPYVILAHYNELDWAESFGVERDLIRFSVGLEETDELVKIFNLALSAIPTSTD